MRRRYGALIVFGLLLASLPVLAQDGEEDVAAELAKRRDDAIWRLDRGIGTAEQLLTARIEVFTLGQQLAARKAYVRPYYDLAQVQAKDVPAPPKFKRGLKGPTPLHKVLQAFRNGTATIHQSAGAPPIQVIAIPPRLSYWGNSEHGDCVTAEEAAAMATYSVSLKLPEIFVTEQAAVQWASAHGFLEGAYLLDVIEAMQKDGIKDENGILRKAGIPSAVDYTKEASLQSALAQGPLSIAIDADALPSGAGSKSGWYAWGGTSKFMNTDHCVGIIGYGPPDAVFKALNTPVPANAPSTVYLVFTWNTIGAVDHKWIVNTCVESWLRTPTVLGLDPTPTPPNPPNPPTPTPGAVTITLTPDQVQSVIQQAGVQPAPLPQGTAVLQPATVQAVVNDIQQSLKQQKGK